MSVRFHQNFIVRMTSSGAIFFLQQQRASIFKLDNIDGWLTVWGHSCST